jgi:hypothetical protein
VTKETELEGVHILGLVDEQGASTVTKPLGEPGFVAQQTDRLLEEEVEVEDTPSPAEPHVAVDKVGETGRPERDVATSVTNGPRVSCTLEALRKSPTEFGLETGQEVLLEGRSRVTQLGDEGSDESPALGFHDEGAQSVVVSKLGDDRERGPVEGTRTDVTDAGARQPSVKFVARLTGERHGQNLVRLEVATLDAALDAQGQNVGLT